MGSRRRSSTSPTRRRYRKESVCRTIEDPEDTFYCVQSLLIWLVASSSLILISPPVLPHSKVVPQSTTVFFDQAYRSIFGLTATSGSKMYSNMNEQRFEQPGQNFYDGAPTKTGPPMGFNRPMGLRWRDDSRMFNQFSPVPIMPVLTEHRSASPFGRSRSPSRPTTSNRFDYSSHDSPSLEDIDLIDVLWRSDIAFEKGIRQVAPAEQYERDLQMLTEKSTVAPLTREEHDRYEDLSKGFYQDFYPTFQNNHNNNNNDILKNTKETTPNLKIELDIPTDEDLADLLEDVSKEEGQLNLLWETVQQQPTQQPLLQNVSMTEGVVYNQNNLTEMELVREQIDDFSSHSQVETTPPTTLFNTTDSNNQQWIRPAEMEPSDVFPNTGYTFIPLRNESETAAVSNGNVEYDHAYQNPQAAAVQDGASPVFDPYHSTRHTYSDCTDSSSTCSRMSSESPRYKSESSDSQIPATRFYGKLVPNEQIFELKSSQKSKIARIVPMVGQRKRGRQSKDEQLASDNRLPVSARQISDMTLSELQQVLKMDKLTEYQRQLIRKIRRRGKNKVAARTCRQRRTDRHDTAIDMSSYI